MSKRKAHWDEMDLGNRPHKASDESVWTDDQEKAFTEAKVFANQLIREFGKQKNTKLAVRGFVNKNGVTKKITFSCRVFVIYNVNDWNASKYAFNIEDNVPEQWDAESIEELSTFFK